LILKLVCTGTLFMDE